MPRQAQKQVRSDAFKKELCKCFYPRKNCICPKGGGGGGPDDGEQGPGASKENLGIQGANQKSSLLPESLQDFTKRLELLPPGAQSGFKLELDILKFLKDPALFLKDISAQLNFKDPKEIERVQNLLNMMPSKLLLEGFVRLEKLRLDNPEYANNPAIATMQRMLVGALMHNNPGATQQSLLNPNQNKMLKQVIDAVNKENQEPEHTKTKSKRNNPMYNPLQTKPTGPTKY